MLSSSPPSHPRWRRRSNPHRLYRHCGVIHRRQCACSSHPPDPAHQTLPQRTGHGAPPSLLGRRCRCLSLSSLVIVVVFCFCFRCCRCRRRRCRRRRCCRHRHVIVFVVIFVFVINHSCVPRASLTSQFECRIVVLPPATVSLLPPHLHCLPLHHLSPSSFFPISSLRRPCTSSSCCLVIDAHTAHHGHDQ